MFTGIHIITFLISFIAAVILTISIITLCRKYSIYDHPTISIPIGSATCGCGCPLTTKLVYWLDLGKKNES